MALDDGKKSSKSNTRITINSMLVGVAATVLFIIMAVNPRLLLNNYWLSMQLALIVPFLIISSLAYSKLGYNKAHDKQNNFAWICFIIGYCFMINVTAILLSAIGLMRVGILLLFTSIGLNYIYAVLDYNFGKGGASEMICKYALLTVLHVFLGLLIIL